MSTRHDRRSFLRHVIGAAGAGLAIPLLSACAPASAPPATPQGAAPTTAPAATKSITKVSYAFASVNGLHLVATVGNERPDIARKFGVEFDLVATTNSPNAVNALIGGSVSVAAVTPDAAWPAQDKAPDVKQLIAVADGTPYVLIGQRDIKKAVELKGKTLGASAIRGGADTTAIRVILSENGLTENDYTIVQAGAISDRTAAMKAKSIDALAQLEPQATMLRDEGFVEFESANNYPALKGVHTIVLMAKKGWYEGNADVAANFVRAWDAVTKWIYDPANKAEILAISKKTMGANDKSAEAVYALHVTSMSVPQSLRINGKYMQQFVANQKKSGADNVPTDAMKYVDSSLVAKALNI
jgi:ABC-type nitrate/sulfonate/bicarbonate transport system substrate-binding protein